MNLGNGDIHQIHAPSDHEINAKGKELVVSEEKNSEWDLNEWKWDSNLFVAERLKLGPSSPNNSVIENGNASEKRRKVTEEPKNLLGEGDASLTLKLGGSFNAIVEGEGGNCEGRYGKRFGSSNSPVCQVDSCNADLSDAKDYHRRHKVCEAHAKSSTVVLGGVLQRFCQQCSRFHILQEFDDEKRSCRRRLAGHNRRRRKTNLDAIVSGHPSFDDDRVSRSILVCLLSILSNMNSANSDQIKDQDLLFQLLGMISRSIGTSVPVNRSGGLLQSPQHLHNTEPSIRVSAEGIPAFLSSYINGITIPEPSGVLCSTVPVSSSICSQDPTRIISHSAPINVARSGNAQTSLPMQTSLTEGLVPQDLDALCTVKGDLRKQSDGVCSLISSLEADGGERAKAKSNDFDLNSMYSESQDYKNVSERMSKNFGSVQNGSCDLYSWPHWDICQTSPAQKSGNSECTSDKSHSSLGENVRCRTERIIFKLFDKDPSDLPQILRSQILNWLSHRPTDIESYIRPGCLILTIYLHLPNCTWQELCGNLTSSLKRLLEASDDIFWRTGWICARVGHNTAFIYNGQVLFDIPLSRSHDAPFIVSVTPVAVALSAEAEFTVKGVRLTCMTTKLLCAFHGKQFVHEIYSDPNEENGSSVDDFESSDEYNKEIQTFSFTCSISNMSGRGFIEVEDRDLSSGFFPFIVAEHDICSELRTLESSIKIIDFSPDEMHAREQVIEFLQEFGWLLERSHLVSRSDFTVLHTSDFSYVRIKWILEFSVEHDWCAVVRKILNILFDRKVGGLNNSMEPLLEEVGPLHRAVRRNCRTMVEFLLKYIPESKTAPEADQKDKFSKMIFKPNTRGPAGITPLHVVASIEGADDVLNLLTDDPEQDWVQTWEKSRDESGFTPEDYARQRGQDRYIQLVRRKLSNKEKKAHLILDMPNSFPTTKKFEESPVVLQGDSARSKEKQTGFNIYGGRTNQVNCSVCEELSVYRSKHRVLHYRPAILSMVAIAAVCVCVGILLKTPPEVLYVALFRWELLKFGYI